MVKKYIFHIGLDGTDSEFGGCTTWTMTNIIDKLVSVDKHLKLLREPYLVRLNPNIPEKTRGNAATSISIETSLKINELGRHIVEQIKLDQSKYDLTEGKDPAVVIFDKIPNNELYQNSLLEYIDFNLLDEVEPIFSWPKLNQSYIGAAAAILADMKFDFTYELLVYRTEKNWNRKRDLILKNVPMLEKKIDSVFSSYDYELKRVLMAPSGPDPVLLGIRGNNKDDLIEFYEKIKILEDIEKISIFKTNQATDIHLMKVIGENRNFKNYDIFSGLIQLISKPEIIRGGHVRSYGIYQDEIFEIMCFEPTKKLRLNFNKLIISDLIYVTGSIELKQAKIRKVIKLESILIVNLEEDMSIRPPLCDCGKRMKNKGLYSEYKCRKCDLSKLTPEISYKKRQFYQGQILLPTLYAQRHLVRPYERMHIQNSDLLN